MVKRWFNNTGSAQVYNAAVGGDFTYWFTDATHTTRITTVQGLPDGGDTVFWDEGVANLGGTSVVWPTTLTVASGTVLLTGNATFDTAATWSGNVLITATGLVNVILDTGWGVHSLVYGGDINISTSGTITVKASNAGQDTEYHDFFLTSSMMIDVSAITPFKLLHDFSLSHVTLAYPSGTWVTLNSSEANALGVDVGHVPALGHILSTDNLFDQNGTLVGGAPVGIVVGGG